MADINTAVPEAGLSGADSYPVKRIPLIVLSMLAGIAIAVLWSAQLVDDKIGVNSANGLLGHNSLTTGIASSAAGVLFAFVIGLAGTFTACNIAAFSAIAPLMEDAQSARDRLRLALRPLGWLAVGVIVVAGLYGGIGATLGKSIPQLSTAMIGGTVPERVLQSVAVFSVIGLIFIYMGLAAIDVVPDPLRRITQRFRYAPQLLMGALIGGFLIGRPWPLFFKMFQYAASTHNGWYGALTFILVSLGNIVLMAVLFLTLSMTRFQHWLQAKPGRVAKFTASALLIGGAFTFFYWGVKVPSFFGYGWWPHVPWN